MRAHSHTRAYMRTHAQARAHALAVAYTCAYAHTRAYTHTYPHAHARARMRIHALTRTRARVFMRVHAIMHSCTHMCTHAHTRAHARIRVACYLWQHSRCITVKSMQCILWYACRRTRYRVIALRFAPLDLTRISFVLAYSCLWFVDCIADMSGIEPRQFRPPTHLPLQSGDPPVPLFPPPARIDVPPPPPRPPPTRPIPPRIPPRRARLGGA